MDVNSIKAFLGGSGKDLMSHPAAAARLLRLTGKLGADGRTLAAPVSVVYVGTATYDTPQGQAAQTGRLAELGCSVRAIRLADPARRSVSETERRWVAEADVIVVSGGNTLYAIRRWEETGLTALIAQRLREDQRRPSVSPLVLAGGSAGTIIWFTGGHSASFDPQTFRPETLEKMSPQLRERWSSEWSYIRVHGMGVLPGMVCPHYDRTQSNGVPRREDFHKMLRRHPSERGVGVDHAAALVLLGDGSYEVFALPADGEAGAAGPGVYIADVVDGATQVRRAPAAGSVGDLLREPTGGVVTPDPLEKACGAANPTVASKL